MTTTPEDADTINERDGTLPKWAQKKLSILKRKVEVLEERLRDIPEDGAAVFTDPYGFITGRRRPLAKRHETVRFYLNDDHLVNRGKDYIEVTAHCGYLDISCDQQIVIIGASSNVVHVEVRPR